MDMRRASVVLGWCAVTAVGAVVGGRAGPTFDAADAVVVGVVAAASGVLDVARWRGRVRRLTPHRPALQHDLGRRDEDPRHRVVKVRQVIECAAPGTPDRLRSWTFTQSELVHEVNRARDRSDDETLPPPVPPVSPRPPLAHTVVILLSAVFVVLVS